MKWIEQVKQFLLVVSQRLTVLKVLKGDFIYYNNKHVEALFQVSENFKSPLWRYTHFREDSVRLQ